MEEKEEGTRPLCSPLARVASQARADATFESVAALLEAEVGSGALEAVSQDHFKDIMPIKRAHFPDAVRHAGIVRLRYFHDARAGELAGVVEYGPEAEGPPTCTHGGLVAALLDDATGMVNVLSGRGGFTVSLTTNYRHFVRLGAPHLFRAWVADSTVNSRKTLVRGEVYAVEGGGRTRLTNTADAIFVAFTDQQREAARVALQSSRTLFAAKL